MRQEHSQTAFDHVDAEPLAHVAVHHLLDNGVQGRVAHDGKVGADALEVLKRLEA